MDRSRSIPWDGSKDVQQQEWWTKNNQGPMFLVHAWGKYHFQTLKKNLNFVWNFTFQQYMNKSQKTWRIWIQQQQPNRKTGTRSSKNNDNLRINHVPWWSWTDRHILSLMKWSCFQMSGTRESMEELSVDRWWPFFNTFNTTTKCFLFSLQNLTLWVDMIRSLVHL